MNQNPFTQTLVVPYIRWIKRDVPLMKLDLEDNDFYDVEAVAATRLYRSNIAYDKVKNLSVTCYKLFMWILFHIPDNAVSIKLDELSLSKHFDCSGKTIQRARHELIAAALIAKQEANRYWVNPQVFASASRLKLYPENTQCVAIKRESKL